MNKLQPDRTVHLRGFDSFAAAASIHSATPAGFKVSGTFRDPADFAVAVLYDADNFFEHPSIRYLPDFDFSGLTLSFNLAYSDGLQPIDSPKYNWIDWATLDCVLADGTKKKVRLWDNASLAGGSFTPASITCTLAAGASAVVQFDRATLWYQNLAFDYIAPAGVASAEFDCYAAGTGTVHQFTINGRTYSHTEADPHGESSADQAAALILAINAAPDPDVIAASGSQPYKVLLTVRPGRAGIAIPVSATDNSAVVMRRTTPQLAAASIANQVNTADWNTAGAPHALLASVSGSAITLTAGRYGTVNVMGTLVQAVSGSLFTGIGAGTPFWIAGTEYTVASVTSANKLTLTAAPGDASNVSYVAQRGGIDGNLIELCATCGTSTLTFDQNHYSLSGGTSTATWNCSLDFTTLGIDQLRQCWLTFAPSLVNGNYPATEWEAAFSAWSLAGDPLKCALQVAGPGSVRIEETDSACVYQGGADWVVESGFYSRYFANRASKAGSSVTIAYTCQLTHDLYIGTSLYVDRGAANVQLDGDPATVLNGYVDATSAIATRRRVRTAVAPGRHVVTLSLPADGLFYFDFLEAAVPTDFPDALTPRPDISPALDFDTDHSYKLSPARLMWIFDKLGYAGPMNEYLGVFWWNQRVRPGATFSSASVAFTGTFAGGESIFLTLNGTVAGKSVFPADTPASIAQHFASYINGAFVGIWASAAGATLAITSRSPAPDYGLTATSSTTSHAGHVAVTMTAASQDAPWIIDDTQPNPLNRATRDWHADFFAQCAARHRDVVTAGSMELVFPPAGYAAQYADGTPVATDTGFGTLKSNHCAAGSSKMIALQKALYRSVADLQAAAGLRPWVQFGEFFWWYFEAVHATGGGMAFYDSETKAAALSALGRPLGTFNKQDDDPMMNGGQDAVFLRNRLRDHVGALVVDIRAAHPNVRCEVLWAYDVNYPQRLPGADRDLGGRLNRFVNLPVEWQRKETSGLDAMKVEALAFGTGYRNLDLAQEAIELFPGFGWPLDSVRYLLPIFGSATPWNRELSMTRTAGIQQANMWAFDHICLFNLDVPEKDLDRRSVVKAA